MLLFLNKKKQKDFCLSAACGRGALVVQCGSYKRTPPGNRLEALHGDRAGQHSIRITGQWRLVFVWRSDGPHEVEIVDYH